MSIWYYICRPHLQHITIIMKRILTTITYILGIIIVTQAQQGILQDSLPQLPNVVVTQDPRIAILASKRIVITKTTSNIPKQLASTKSVRISKTGRVNMPGYRVQVMSSTDRNAVYGLKAQLYQRFPSHKMYVIAQAPFFKLRFGNFPTKAEADKFKKILSPMSPTGALVVPDIIETIIAKPTTPPVSSKEITKK